MNSKARKIAPSQFALAGMGLLSLIFVAGLVLAALEVNHKLGFFGQPVPPSAPANPGASSNGSPQASPSPAPVISSALVNPQDGSVHLVALGDSLTRGVGDLSGKGYIGRVKDALQSQMKKPVVYTNIAVSGQTSAQLDELLNQSEVQPLLKQATLIIFTIGGNDLFGSTNQLENLSQQTIDAAGQSYKAHLTSIVHKIRAANPTCPAYLVAIYNPFYTVLDPQLQADRYVNEFNQTMLALTGQTQQFYVVPVYDLFQRQEDKFLSSDHFHPNDAGYQRIAERVLQDLDLVNN